jgi:hypothetical protein
MARVEYGMTALVMVLVAVVVLEAPQVVVTLH